jgi:hypothetical protein
MWYRRQSRVMSNEYLNALDGVSEYAIRRAMENAYHYILLELQRREGDVKNGKAQESWESIE